MYLSWKESSLFDSDKKQGITTPVGISPTNQLNHQKSQQRVRTLLEDLMQIFLRECVHACEIKYFKGLRSMLKAFHDTKRSDELNGMLLRIYDPIIWRSLRCANAKVRSQAAIMFLDVFPLQHEDACAEDDDKILQKQFDLLSVLLKDPDHQVRSNAVLGVCNILKEYWEVLPINTTHNILKFLIDTLAFDSSSANVRYSLFVGLGVLLQQPLTHDLMKLLLPMLNLSIHDKSEKVRIAFIKILCQVKSIRGLHFYDIVSVDHLLERLAEDHHRPHICKVMTQLLLNSFYPQENIDNNIINQNQQIEYEQISRCIQFIDINPIAAEAFYSSLHEHISIGCIAKLITMLFSFLLASEQSPEKVVMLNITQLASKDKKRLRACVVINDNDENGSSNTITTTKESNVDDHHHHATTTTTTTGVGGNNINNKRLPYLVRIGLMRVIHCLLESVSNQFAIQEPARNLVCRYLTIDKTNWLLRQCTIINSQEEDHHDARYLIPISFKIIASATTLARMDLNYAVDGSCDEVSSNDFNALITIFIPTWKATNGDGTTNTAAAGMLRSLLASAVIDIARSSDDEVSVIHIVSITIIIIITIYSTSMMLRYLSHISIIL